MSHDKRGGTLSVNNRARFPIPLPVIDLWFNIRFNIIWFKLSASFAISRVYKLRTLLRALMERLLNKEGGNPHKKVKEALLMFHNL